MAVLHYAGESFPIAPNESVLECLEQHGHQIPASCRSGVCQSCVMKAVSGEVPAKAQVGLRANWIAEGYFLSCSCYPETDLSVGLPTDANIRVSSVIQQLDALNGRTVRVRVTPESEVRYRPGQFFNLDRGDGAIRSYSAASVPGLDDTLEFHIALMPGGAMSGWFHGEARPGDRIQIQGPLGTCFYVADETPKPLLLACTGTGLAPLYGVARDALRQGHSGEIHLVHGGLTPEGLYLVEELRALAAAHGNFHYHPCVLRAGGAESYNEGDIKMYLKSVFPSLKGWGVYLCGDPDLVRQMQRQSFLAGARMQEILADAFIPAAAPAKKG